MPLPSSNILSSRSWWIAHLAECACRSGTDAYDYVYDAFGVSQDEVNRFCIDSINFDNPSGPWPQFVLGLAAHALAAHSIVITYFGKPRYEITYSHAEGDLLGLWAIDGGNFMRPAFRWHEIERLSRLTHTPDTTLLLLLPSCDIPQAMVAQASARIENCFDVLGYKGPLISRFAVDLANGCASERRWFYDQSYGWLTDYQRCWRCRNRLQLGLSIPNDDSFFSLKRFTDLVELDTTPGYD